MTGRVRRIGVLAGLAVVEYVLALRPRLLRWGATEEEVHQTYPGADIVPGGKRTGTMAVTIDAPPSRVWPWLVQMGCDRAGWYSWDWLDNGGSPSADRIHPEWQQVAIGDRWAAAPSGNAWFEVAAVETERFLALRAPLDLRGRPFHPGAPRPRFYSDSTWCFLLRELPRGRTRLLVSGFAAVRPKLPLAVGNFLFWEPAHWIMQLRQFANLKQRAERSPARQPAATVGSDAASLAAGPSR